MLGRRGPLYPLIALIVLLLMVSMSFTTQSVKRRLQVAMGPYIPRRASDAVSWQLPVPPERKARLNVKGIVAPSQAELSSERTKRKDGRTIIELDKKHPIPALMREAKMKWAALTSKQSTTFSGAVDEYRRRYDMNPPKGFDQWYASMSRQYRAVVA